MFSFQPKDDLIFGTNSKVSEIDIFSLIPDNQLMRDQSVPTSFSIDFSSKANHGKQRSQGKLIGRNNQDRKTEIGRATHRDIERRRRQEMSKFYASLRSLLPPEHIKGKRSACDNMQEAVNYIKKLEASVQELQLRRDKIKSSGLNSNNRGNMNQNNCVRVNVGGDGVEILISSSIQGNELKLSLVLEELIRLELDVVSYMCTKANEKFLHKIQAKENDMKAIDVPMLQERLRVLIN